jgi:predicted DCC family thiol-disulfide oxidoreductase YuxK
MDKIILFDGVCNLCSASVNFIIDHDTRKIFRFASLQSEFSKELISNTSRKYQVYTAEGLLLIDEKIQKELNSLNSIIYFENGVFYTKSEAALRIAKHLDGIYRFISIGKILPSSLRDSIYEYIARNRYRWFGKSESCRMPTPNLKERFFG